MMTRPLRVLHLLKTSEGATWALRQMKILVQLGVDVHVALPAGGSKVPLYHAAGVTTHFYQFDLPIRRIWRAGSAFRNLRTLVDHIKPDIIHSHFVGTTLTMRLALGKSHPIPRIFQVPGPLHLEHPFFRKAEIATAGSSDYWIGTCRWTCDAYRHANIAAKKIFLSYYGSDVDTFTPGNGGILRKELNIPDETKIIGMVAFMYAPKRYLRQKRGLKGHEDLIDAIALCKKRGYPVHGVFAGGAWNGAAKYWDAVRDYGHSQCGDSVTFLGTRNDIPKIYPDFDIAVHPSHSENVGGAVESLLMGIPTITTHVGGFPDVIQHGKTGWLVSPKSPSELADRIIEVLDSDAVAINQITAAGRDLVQNLFDIERTAREIHAVYHQILDSGGDPDDHI